MQRAIRFSVLGTGLLALAACGPTIRADRDESVPVPRGATWAWGAAEAGARDTGASYRRAASPVSEIVQQRFQRAIDAAMEAKGYRQVGDTAQADFVLTTRFGGRPVGGAPAHAYSSAVVGVGFGGGWGYRPFGFGRFGFYRPWGFYQPWGFGLYGAPMWGGYYGPAYPAGYRVYSDGALEVLLRHKPTGYVAWSGRVGSDAFYGHRLSQERVREIVDKLFRSLH
jgi:hypothetical protein